LYGGFTLERRGSGERQAAQRAVSRGVYTSDADNGADSVAAHVNTSAAPLSVGINFCHSSGTVPL